jgi:hypothetical protein
MLVSYISSRFASRSGSKERLYGVKLFETSPLNCSRTLALLEDISCLQKIQEWGLSFLTLSAAAQINTTQKLSHGSQ